MAAASGKKGYRIRFELSLTGLLGAGVVCFCIFLWMFLLGLWAGQTGLISGKSFSSLSSLSAIPTAPGPPARRDKVSEIPAAARESDPESGLAPAGEVAAPETPPEPKAGAISPAPALAPAEAADQEDFGSYSIQVGAFRDSRNVEEALQKWRAKGYEPFSRPPGANEQLTKVYLGHYPEAAAAREEAEKLAGTEGSSPVVVLIPADQAKRP